MKRGAFITLEGGEGGGKSTQLKLLAEALKVSGQQVEVTREPGGTPGAEAIRRLVVEGHADKWDPLAETLLFMAARAEHLARFVKPKMEEGAIILCDRFMDSTFVYQGIAKGLGIKPLRKLHEQCFGKFLPDLTLILDIESEQGLLRAGNRAGNETRFEGMAIEFHRQVRDGFLSIAREEPQRCAVIDATQSPEQVHAQILQVLKQRLGIAP